MVFPKRSLLTVYNSATKISVKPMELMRPVLIGPVGQVAKETNLYNFGTQVEHVFSELPDSATLDNDNIKVFVEDGFFSYFEKTPGNLGTALLDVNNTNKIIFSNLIVANANGFQRTPVLNQDVKIGHYAKITAVIGSSTYQFFSKIRDYNYAWSTAAVGNAQSDPANAGSQNSSTSFSQIDGTVNNVSISNVDASNYNSLDDGYITRQYIITVIQGGNPSNARLRVSSTDGLEFVDNVIPNSFGSPTDIGTKGLKVTFTTSGGDVFVVGQVWQVDVSQSFTAPTVTSGGSYSGLQDKVYIIKVKYGGMFSNTSPYNFEGVPPVLDIMTNDGSETFTNVVVVKADSFVNIGSFGVKIKFFNPSGKTQLRAGDVYYISVTASKPQQINGIILENNLPSIVASVDLNVEFGKIASLELPKFRNLPSSKNIWQVDTVDNKIVFDSEIYLPYDTEFPNSTTHYLKFRSGKLVIHYRYWVRFENQEAVYVVNKNELYNLFGPDIIENPLVFAAARALEHSPAEYKEFLNESYVTNCGGLYIIPVNGDPNDLSNWRDAADHLDENLSYYHIVPLTDNPQILSFFAQLVTEHSNANNGKYKVLWISPQVDKEFPIVDKTKTSDGQEVLATVTADPVNPNFYNRINVSSGNINFLNINNLVKPGDWLRINYTTASDGSERYSVFKVEEIISSTVLRINKNYGSPLSLPIKIEIWRTAQKQHVKEFIFNKYSSIISPDVNLKRIRVVYPNVKTTSDVSIFDKVSVPNLSGAILAAISSAIVPHQSLINIKINDSLSVDNRVLTNAYLRVLADSGICVLNYEKLANENYVFSCNTLFASVEDSGNEESVFFRNEMYVRAVDAVLKYLQSRISPYLGQINYFEDLQNWLVVRFKDFSDELANGTNLPESGKLVNEIKLDNLTLVTTGPNAPKIELRITVDGKPIPINKIDFVVV